MRRFTGWLGATALLAAGSQAFANGEDEAAKAAAKAAVTPTDVIYIHRAAYGLLSQPRLVVYPVGLAKACQYAVACEVPVTTEFLAGGDRTPNIPKQLSVTFYCAPQKATLIHPDNPPPIPPVKTIMTKEGEKLTLSCEDKDSPKEAPKGALPSVTSTFECGPDDITTMTKGSTAATVTCLPKKEKPDS